MTRAAGADAGVGAAAGARDSAGVNGAETARRGAAAGVMDAATWEDLYQLAVDRLGSAREARWMVEEASGERLGRAAGRPGEKSCLRVADMISRRAGGEPLQYVLGSWAFRGLELMVDRRVLIPRPETEQVVEVALAELDRLGVRASAGGSAVARRQAPGAAGRPGAGPPAALVVDLGTGSGAIALAIAAERPGVDVWATDISGEALAVAQANVAGNAATTVRLARGDWWDALPADLAGRVELVVSNPPYVSTGEMASIDREVSEWEPRQALEAGPDGTEDVESILAGTLAWLRPGGTAVVEIAPHQAKAAAAMARAAGFAETDVVPDLAGRPRTLVARRLGASGTAASRTAGDKRGAAGAAGACGIGAGDKRGAAGASGIAAAGRTGATAGCEPGPAR